MAKRRKQKTKTQTSRKWRFRLNLSWIKMPDMYVLRRSAVGMAWLLTIGGLIAGWVISVPKLQAFASQQRFADQVEVRFIDPPRWFKDQIAATLERSALLQVSGDPLRRDELIAIRELLLASGWFESIDQVRRTNDDLIEIHARYIRPITVIRDHEGDHLVDVTGRLLPRSYRPGQPGPIVEIGGVESSVIAISGVRFPRPQRPGLQWEGTDVQAGLTLLRLIYQQPWRHQVAEIDVSGHLSGQPIKLRTDTGSVIVWGGPPGEEAALEELAPGKIHRLTFMFAEHGRIDMHYTGEIDITDPKHVSTR